MNCLLLDIMKEMAQEYGKSVNDNGWGIFTRFLEYKQEWNGQYLIKVEKYFPSSKMCSVCGHVYKDLTLDMREWECESCGSYHDRDHNAAINIRIRGLEILTDWLAQSA